MQVPLPACSYFWHNYVLPVIGVLGVTLIVVVILIIVVCCCIQKSRREQVQQTGVVLMPVTTAPVVPGYNYPQYPPTPDFALQPSTTGEALPAYTATNTPHISQFMPVEAAPVQTET